MSEQNRPELNDLSVEVMNAWGDAHNEVKSARIMAREQYEEARRAEIAVDDAFSRVMAAVNELELQLIAGLISGPMASDGGARQ